MTAVVILTAIVLYMLVGIVAGGLWRGRGDEGCESMPQLSTLMASEKSRERY